MHGGDIFFTGIARTMAAKPVVPHSFDFRRGLHLRDDDNVSNEEAGNTLMKAQMDELKAMTTVKFSIGGGTGMVRDPPSPNKA